MDNRNLGRNIPRRLSVQTDLWNMHQTTNTDSEERKCWIYVLKNSKHLLFLNHFKLYGKDESQVTSFVDTLYIFRADIRMEFRLKKTGDLPLKKGQRNCMDM